MADTAQQAAARRALRARGDELAPRADAPHAGRRAEVRGHPSTTRRRPTSASGGRGQGDDIDLIGGRGQADDDGDQADSGTGQELGGRGQRVTLNVPKPFRSTSRVLVVEFVASLALIALKPKEPATPGKASESVVPQIAGIMVVFLLLAMVGSAGARAQRISNLFGGLVTLVLAFHNHGNVLSAVTSVTAYKTPAAPAVSPSLAPGESGSAATVLPTPTGTATGAQAYVSGWRGIVPNLATASGNAAPTPSGQLSVNEQLTGQ